MPTQEDFDRVVPRFKGLETARGQMYDMAMNLLREGYEVEACLLILATWNFADFRHVLTTFDLGAFRGLLRETAPTFDDLRAKEFRTADFDVLAPTVEKLYGRFKGLVHQTGAAKLLHFKQPNLFVMWDTDIRKMYGIPNKADPPDYTRFLKCMQDEFRNIRWDDEQRPFTKAIDEYNFVVAHSD